MEIRKCKEYHKEKAEVRKGIPVYLNVYSISGVNYFFQTFGLGIFHTGVEVCDREYSFGSTDRDYSGVIAIRPGSLGFELKEKLFLGNTLYSGDEIRYLGYLISYIWRGLTYDPFSKNCNNFTKFFAECLVKHSVNYPNYINRFTNFRTLFRCLYDPIKLLVGDIVQMKPDSGGTSTKSPEKRSEPAPEKLEPRVSELQNEQDESNETVSEQEAKKKKKKRNYKLFRWQKRLKRYRIKCEEPERQQLLIEVNTERVNNVDETYPNTSKTRIVSPNDFFKNFNFNCLSKFESHLLQDNIPLKSSPRLFLDDTQETNTFLKDVSSLNDMTINRTSYEAFEEIVKSIQKKGQEKNISSQRRKLYFLNNLVKYMKIAIKMCTIERNYERAITFYKYCVEITEELLLMARKNVQGLDRNKSFKGKVDIENEHEEENRIINENSINIELVEEDFMEYSTYYDNIEFLLSTQVKLYHSIIFCNQRLFLFDEITYYCDKLLAIDQKDWVARLKRGLYYYLCTDKAKAKSEFKLALEGCPDRELLKSELDKLV